MRLDGVHDPEAAGTGPHRAAAYAVDRAQGAPPAAVFRRLLLLRFPDPGEADRIAVAAGPARRDTSPRLSGRFEPLDYDPLTAAEPALRATTSDGPEGSIVVEIPAPRAVAGVVLGGDRRLQPGDVVELYRIDGEALADGPSAILPGGLPPASGIADAISSLAAAVAGAPADPLAAERSAALPAAAPIAGDLAVRRFTAAPPFTDRRFALRLKRTGARPALRHGHLERLTLRGLPTGARLGLAPADRPDEAVFFWRADGEVGGTLPPSAGEVEAGPAFAEELQRQLDQAVAARRAQGGGGPLEVALAIESDAPCRFRLDRIGLSHWLELTSFPGGDAKRTLRFSGRALESNAVPLGIPPGATVVAAEVALGESLGAGRLAGLGEIDASAGLLLRDGWRAAQPVRPQEAATVSGVALALWALAPGAEVAVEIQPDHQGVPSGAALAAGSVRLDAAGRPVWGVADFARPVVLSTAPYWLIARAADGEAIWLAEAAGAPGTVRWAALPGTAAPAGAPEGLAAVYRLRTVSPAAGDGEAPVTVSIGGVSIGGVAASGVPGADGRLLDLTAALAGGSGPAVPPLEVASALAGSVTLSAPRFRYDP